MFTLYYVMAEVIIRRKGPVKTGTWAVYSAQFADITDPEPIEDSTVLVSGNHSTEAEADKKAAALQRRSYSENRRA